MSILAQEWDAAVEACQTAVREYRTVNLPMMLSTALAGLSCALLGNGDLAGARRAAEEIVSISEEIPELFLPRVESRIALARVLLRSDEFESDTERLLDEASELVERTGTRLMAPIISIERAELARRRGEPDTRERHLERARELYRAMGATRLADRLAK